MKKLLLLSFCLPLILHAQTGDICMTFKGSSTNPLFTQVHLASFLPNSADTTEPEIVSEAWTCDGIGFPSCDFRALIKYDISSIPAGAYIKSAKLYLYAKSHALNGDHVNPMYGDANASLLQRVTQPWKKSTVGWLNQPTVTEAGQKTLAQSTSSTEDYVVNVTNFIQYWSENPEKNYGMLLRLVNESPYNSMIFNSGQAKDSLQPTLVVCYSLEPPPPPTDTCITIKGSVTNKLFTQVHLASFLPNSSDTTEPEIVSEAWTCDGNGFPSCNFRALIKYDVSSIPADAQVTSAKLYLYAKSNALNGDHINPMYGSANSSLLQQVIDPWTKSTVGWENQPAVNEAGEKTLPQSTSSQENYVVNVTSFVQYWVQNPDKNYGALLRLVNESAYNSMIFNSGQAADNLQPKLVICYTKNVLASLISDFQSSILGNNVNLSWKIENGISFTNIGIERSDNGQTFTRIGNILPDHTTSEVKYSFSDNLFGKSVPQEYYRLALLNKDGSSIYGNTLLVKFKNNNNSLRVLPNPVRNSLQLLMSTDKAGKADLTLINVIGQVVNRASYQLIEGSNSILMGDVHNLASGIYMIRISVNGQTFSQKFVKE